MLAFLLCPQFRPELTSVRYRIHRIYGVYGCYIFAQCILLFGHKNPNHFTRDRYLIFDSVRHNCWQCCENDIRRNLHRAKRSIMSFTIICETFDSNAKALSTAFGDKNHARAYISSAFRNGSVDIFFIIVSIRCIHKRMIDAMGLIRERQR